MAINCSALDVILTDLERTWGHEPRLDRAYRLVVAERVTLDPNDPTTGLVAGDSGRSYWASATGGCQCPDAERGPWCKHALAVQIAARLQAAEQPPAPPKLLKTYEDAYGVCNALGCQEDRESGEPYCSRHVLVDAL